MIQQFKKFKKLYLLLAIFIVAVLFSPFLNLVLNSLLNNFGLWSAIIIGFFYSFSFTSGAASVMVSNIESNFFIFSFLVAVGAALADMTIFKFIKTNFKDEVDHLFHLFKLDTLLNRKSKTALGLILIGSPVPDEIGVMLLNEGQRLSKVRMFILCFVSNFVFIYIIAKFL